MEDIKESKNILWIDILKFLAMFLVVFEHVVLAFKLNTAPYISDIRNLIITFHMPIFFIIAGYLYKQRDKFKNYYKILYSLLIPYFIYQFLYLPLNLGYYISVEYIPAIKATIKCFIGILLGDNLGTTGSRYALSVCPACWFIMVMIQLRLLFAHINITKRSLVTVSLLSFTSLKLLTFFDVNLYFCIKNTLYAIPYFALGYYLKNYCELLKFKHTLKGKIADIILLGLFLQIVFNLKINHHGILLLSYACGIAGFLLCMRISQLFNNSNSFVDLIGKNTLFLIFFQSLFLFISKWCKCYNVLQFLPNTIEKLLYLILYSLIIYITSYFVIKVINKLNLSLILGKYNNKEKNN